MKLFVALVLVSVASAQVKLPPYTRQVLSNGAVVDVMPRRDVPLITIRVIVKGGTESEPAELPGLSSVVAEMLRHGTAKRSAEAVKFHASNPQYANNGYATLVRTGATRMNTSEKIAVLSIGIRSAHAKPMAVCLYRSIKSRAVI